MVSYIEKGNQAKVFKNRILRQIFEPKIDEIEEFLTTLFRSFRISFSLLVTLS